MSLDKGPRSEPDESSDPTPTPTVATRPFYLPSRPPLHCRHSFMVSLIAELLPFFNRNPSQGENSEQRLKSPTAKR